jgi:hypothetical protein
MQTPFAQVFKRENSLNLDDAETQELTHTANTVRPCLVKKEPTKLFDKEAIACMLATD